MQRERHAVLCFGEVPSLVGTGSDPVEPLLREGAGDPAAAPVGGGAETGYPLKTAVAWGGQTRSPTSARRSPDGVAERVAYRRIPSRALEPADPTGVVIVGMGVQLLFECCEDLADERIVAMTGEDVVGEQQQPKMGSVAVEPTLVAANEVRDVVGDHRPALPCRVVEQLAVVDASKMFKVGVLDGDDIVAAVAQQVGHRGGDHLVEQQPHSSKACSASYRPRSSAASRRRRSI